MEDDNLLDEEILVQETQDVSPTAFSRNLINRLGFSSQQHGTETVSLDNGNNDNIPPNLSRGERKALRELICDKDLIINKADKGSTIVVQNRADYIKTALEQLNDPITYRLLDGNPTSCICANIVFLLQDFLKKGLLNKETVAYCSPPKIARSARLYMLKKLHKNPMGLRPIVSSCESPTENISQYVDFWLQPLMKAIPSFLKDTSELINELVAAWNQTSPQ